MLKIPAGNALPKTFFLLCMMACCLAGKTQEEKESAHVFFPAPMKVKWQKSVGITLTTMPLEITEEQHFRVPAFDLHVLKKINKSFYLEGRTQIQFLQNLFILGPRWAAKISNRLSFSAGDDLGFWFGFINTGGLKTKGSGWQNYPNLSLGYRCNKNVFLTVKAESMMKFNVNTYAGKTKVDSKYRLFSGSSYTLAVEQPFYGKKSITLGFRAAYTDFFWQTWTLFEPYDRNLFFPQFIVGLIL
jgi:hypothetical protein